MARIIPTGTIKYIVWGDPNLNLVGSVFDDNQGTTLHSFTDLSTPLSFKSGRENNTLTAVVTGWGYQVCAKSDLYLPDSTYGAGDTDDPIPTTTQPPTTTTPAPGTTTTTTTTTTTLIPYNTTLLGQGIGSLVSGAQVSLTAYVGDVMAFNSVTVVSGLPAAMAIYVGSVAPENQVALVSFPADYIGTRFRYTVKAGNHPSISSNTVFNAAGLTFIDGDRILS